MIVSVDPADPTPPFVQVREQIAALIVAGQLAEGSRLPPIRQLASDLSLAPGTVARAYQDLESAGLVATARARGTRVIGHHAVSEQATAAADAYIDVARRSGLDDSALLALVRVRAAR